MSKGKGSDKKEDVTVNELMVEVVNEAKKLANNEITSCYNLIEKTKELIAQEKFNTPSK